jgi:hypothetical protein
VRIIEHGGNVAFSFAGGKPTRPVAKGLIDVAGRTAWMDKQVIDRQVVGGWPDIFAYELPIEGERWCRLTNAARRHRAIAIRSMIRQLSTNDLIDDINVFDAEQIKAEARSFKLPYKRQ